MSTIKVDNIDSKDSTGNITVSRPLVATLTAGSINNLNNLLTPANASVTAAKMATTDTLPAWNGSALTNLPAPADNSVTGAKLNISLLAGDTMYASGTDTLAKLAKGTAAQVLTMNAGATAPEWATAAGGGDLVFLAEDTAGAATKEFTSADGIDTSVYDNYLFQFEGVWPTTQGSDLQCTFYSDDGSTALTAAVYRYVGNGTDTNGVELYHSSTNATTMNLTPSGDMRASGTNFGGGKVWLKLTSDANYWTHHLEMDFVEWSTNDLHTTQGHFRYFASTALPAVKFHTDSSNINGKIRMYGLKYA